MVKIETRPWYEYEYRIIKKQRLSLQGMDRLWFELEHRKGGDFLRCHVSGDERGGLVCTNQDEVQGWIDEGVIEPIVPLWSSGDMN